MIKLKLFGNRGAGADAQAKSKVLAQLLELPGKGFYLKRPGSPGVEPQYRCEDGRWRKYDRIPELPHSTAATDIAAAAAKT